MFNCIPNKGYCCNSIRIFGQSELLGSHPKGLCNEMNLDEGLSKTERRRDFQPIFTIPLISESHFKILRYLV
jgi:hypothetical protein